VPEVKTGLLPDSQASPSETTSERPSEEAYGTDAFGVQTIHGVPAAIVVYNPDTREHTPSLKLKSTLTGGLASRNHTGTTETWS
jgi:hypothetical protein